MTYEDMREITAMAEKIIYLKKDKEEVSQLMVKANIAKKKIAASLGRWKTV